VVLNLEGTIVDNEALHTVGVTCTKLRPVKARFVGIRRIGEQVIDNPLTIVNALGQFF
jgi:hypothetical protein